MRLSWDAPTNSKLAFARLASKVFGSLVRLAGGDPGALRTRRRGIQWDLDLDEGIDLAIFLFGDFETRTARALRRIVRHGMCALDIGANRGAHTLPLAKLVGREGRVVAIEPTEAAFGRLIRTASLNPALESRITPIRAALVAQNGESAPESIYASWRLSASEGIHSLHGGTLCSAAGARSLPLDALWRELGLARVDLLKIDVDGYELDVLRGGEALLREHSPILIVELCEYTLAERGQSLGALLELLLGLGYRIYDLAERRCLSDDPPALVASIPKGGGINVVCRSTTQL